MRVLMPLPDHDFDVTEVAVPWRVLTDAGHEVVFAAEQAGADLAADPRLLTGVLFGQLGAAAEPRRLYREMTASAQFREPLSWAELKPDEYDGLLVAGGHAPGLRQYLGSRGLQGRVAAFWGLAPPVGAICHGVLVLARTIDPVSGRS